MIKLLALLWFSFYTANVMAVNKDAVFIVIGAGGRIDQELPEYAEKLNEEGYYITIHSFDEYYEANGDIAKLGTPHNTEILHDGLNNDRFKKVNYTIYDSIARDFIMMERKDKKNTIDLFRYGVHVWKNNRAENYIKKIVSDSVKYDKVVVFIDSTHCGKLQPVTEYLFDKYKNNIVVLHAVFDKVQIVSDDFISKTKDENCPMEPKYIQFVSMEDYREFLFDNMKRINDRVKKSKKFYDLSVEDQQVFLNSLINLKSGLNVIGDFTVKNCVNDSLENSGFVTINQEVIDEYCQIKTLYSLP